MDPLARANPMPTKGIARMHPSSESTGVVRTEADHRRGTPAAPGRRRLLTGGITAAPILLSAVSRSALATGTCQSPSRAMSGNLSPRNESFNCGGKSPGFWKQPQKFGNWVGALPPNLLEMVNGSWVTCSESSAGSPSLGSFFTLPYGNGSHKIGNGNGYGTTFVSIFSPSAAGMVPVVPAADSDPRQVSARPVTLWEVLAFPTEVGGTMSQTARALVAAYLNTKTIGNYPLTTLQVLDMWNQLVTLGSYCPISGCGTPWNATQVKTYLETTYT
ncbi:MAG: hypothetical protein IT514_03140 [Burkholderiales bacterium]|nr:hypothetical protein [Burkholderiales bacterium]